MGQEPKMIVGIPWYRTEEDYEKLLSVFTDSDVLPGTYREWLEGAEQGLKTMGKQGHSVEKVYLDPVAFADWCRKSGKEANASARLRFVNEYLATKHHTGD